MYKRQVPDGVIEKVWSSIKHFSLSGKIICHTSGALSSEVFSDISKRGGFGFSIHPLFAAVSYTHLALNPAITSATQWFERTLDDSANKRLSAVSYTHLQ